MNEEKGCRAPTPRSVRLLYEKARDFNNSINLEATVRVNENFFIGRQWEGVNSNGLPTPVLNFLKRVVGFQVATICSDSLTVTAAALPGGDSSEAETRRAVDAVNGEFARISERCGIGSLTRELARNAAVDGDGCIFSYWDSEGEGRIVSECIENTRVFFGNPNIREVQRQPWIIIESREQRESLQRRAEQPENLPREEHRSTVSDAIADERLRVLLFLRRGEDGKIHAFECCGDSVVRSEWCLEIRLYPLVWMCWDFVPGCYHGQAMISGLIPNQIAVNKLWAMSLTSLTRTAWPKIIYDRTRISQWDNRVGAAIPVNGGDMASIARVIDPVGISPQVSQLIGLLMQQTQDSLGATSVVLGDAKPENTSAIAALSKAAITPIEITRSELYRTVEELFRIYLEFMGAYYGRRRISGAPDESLAGAAGLAGVEMPAEIATVFDFSQVLRHDLTIKLDVGASSYFGEIQSLQSLENLLRAGHITAVQYLERIPDGYVPDRQGLIAELKAAQQAPILQTESELRR